VGSHPEVRLAFFCACVASACGDDEATGGPPTFGDWAPAFDAESSGWLLSAWGPSDDRVFAVGGVPDRPEAAGEGVVMERTGGPGAAWSAMDLPPDTPIVNWVYGFGPDDVWAVGDNGCALHYDGAAWRTTATPTNQNLWGVWGAAPDDVWAVGGGTTPVSSNVRPTILRWDGDAWREVAVPDLVPASASQLFKVWGTSAANVLIVGASGVILRWDGVELAQVTDRPPAHTSDYISLWGTGPDRIVVVGGRANAQIAVWDGAAWSDVPLPRNPGLNGVWMDAPDTVFTVGVRGIASTIHLAPEAGGLSSTVAQRDQLPGISGIDLHAVFGTPSGELISVGGNFQQANGPFRGAAMVAPIRGVGR